MTWVLPSWILVLCLATFCRTLIAKVPGSPDKDYFPKVDFHIDLAAGACTSPTGNVNSTLLTLLLPLAQPANKGPDTLLKIGGIP